MRIIQGRSGSGKSYFCMNEIKENLEASYDGPLIYIVPEQFSLNAEYDVSNVIGRGGILEVQVLTFKRLCHRIYNEFCFKKESISKSGKAMLVYSIMKDLENELVLLKGVDKKQGLVSTVCDLISEFKRYNVMPDVLMNANAKDSRLANKLRELAYIYKEYETQISGKFLDDDDDLRLITDYIEKSKIVANAKIWIDGFDGFTPQELEVIKALNKVADISIGISAADNASELFLLNNKTVEKLKRFANLDVVKLEEQRRFNNDELRYLERYWGRFPIEKFGGTRLAATPPQSASPTPPPQGEGTAYVDISIMPNLYDEVEKVAYDISKKVRDEKYRYNDIMVVSRNVEAYESIFKMIFERYDIPFFVDSKSELSREPLICLVLSLLDICNKNFQTQDVISYLKTGLSNIEDVNDIDKLENYVLKFGIKGAKWLSNWDFDTDEVNTSINDIRENVVAPIVNFKASLDGKKTVRDIAVGIYEFLKEINVEFNIQNMLEMLKGKDVNSSVENKYANTYIQVWNIFVNLLDEMVDTLGDKKISFDKFAHILKQGISTTQIGVIPTTKDGLMVGDVSRSRSSHIKIMYVVGVNDGVFPMPYTMEGFLTDSDRNELLDENIEIAKDTKMLLLEENFNIYKILTLASDEIHLSYPIADNTGGTLRPSSIINDVKAIFPNVTEHNFLIKQHGFKDLVNTVDSTFVHLAKGMRKKIDDECVDSNWDTVYKWYQDNNPRLIALIESGLSYNNITKSIQSDLAKGLYGSTMKSSVSKMETFASCPFMFYLKYGLNLKERKTFKLETPDVGIFMHDILDKFSKHIESNGLSWRDINRSELDELASKIVDQTLAERKYNIFTSNNRLRFLSIKLKRIVKRILWIITLHIKDSDFDVAGSEMTFGEDSNYPAVTIELSDGSKLVLNGKIDRIDIAKTEEGNYLRVIDYKSSSKAINLSNVFYGLQLQLITYLDVASTNDLISGGALYLKLDDPMIKEKKNISPEEIENKIRENLKMNGIILADARLVKAMDTSMVKDSTNLNLSQKETSEGVKYSKMPTATKEELKNLCRHTKNILKKFAEEILNGAIENEPLRIKKENPCAYCDYKEICNFDRELGNRFKKVAELKNDEVFEQTRLF